MVDSLITTGAAPIADTLLSMPSAIVDTLTLNYFSTVVHTMLTPPIIMIAIALYLIAQGLYFLKNKIIKKNVIELVSLFTKINSDDKLSEDELQVIITKITKIIEEEFKLDIDVAFLNVKRKK